ncbi:MAG: M1 family metallopeptidase [Thermoplasmata archaeon]
MEPPASPRAPALDYRIDLTIGEDLRSWTGTIAFEVTEEGRTLALDARDLAIRSARIDGTEVPVTVDAAGERIMLPLPAGPSGPRSVAIDFAGRAAPKGLLGLYPSRTRRGEVLTSQCAPTGARRIFPCRDRPDAKARFALAVTAPAEAEVIANGRLRRVDFEGERRRWSFDPTPPMAPYLFYLGVGPWVRTARPGARVGVVTTADQPIDAGRALAAGERALAFFEEYFGIRYPLPKLDLIAVAELAWGAMENWGAIVFQESRLALDDRAPEADRRLSRTTIAHEIAHQWFGNLVTMPDWDEIWLNESFATFLAYRACERIWPEMRAWDDFLAIGPQRALWADGFEAIAAIRQPLASRDEIGAAFDPAIAYGKGASLLAMLEGAIGEPAFRGGIRRYLERHAYGTATTAELWAALGEAAGTPVREWIAPWIDRPGHPVVEVGPPEGDGTVALRQRRFLLRGPPEDPTPWPIPLPIHDGVGRPSVWNAPRGRIPAALAGPERLGLAAGFGFYRVLRPAEEVARLPEGFAGLSLPARWSTLTDLGAFAIAGEVPFSAYAALVRAAEGMGERPIVQAIASTLVRMAEWAPGARPVVELARRYLGARFAAVGPRAAPEEPPGTGVVREFLADARVRLDAGFARQASELYLEWDRTDPALRPAAAVGRARSDPSTAPAEIRHRIARGPPASERAALERALAWLDDPAGVEAVLEEARLGRIHKGNVAAVLTEAARNPAGRAVAWRWWQDHADAMVAFFEGTIYLPTLLRETIPLLGRVAPEEAGAFFTERRFPGCGRAVRAGLEGLAIARRFEARASAEAP